jgi:large subunit ribosomal protein L25
MEKIQLKTQGRELAHRNSKNLTREGLIPAELYGNKIDNTHLALNQIEFEKALRKAGESTIIELQMPDGGMRNVLIQDVQRHYLNGQPIHVDFLEVSMTEKLTATVQIEFIGEPDAVKVLGGTLVKVLSEVEVECFPADLPHNFEVDVTALKTFDDILEVKDIPHSDKVDILTDAEEVIAKVQPPRDMEAEEAASQVDEAAAVAAAVGPEEGAEESSEGGDKKEEKSE